jgi:hypothetical protein
VAGAGRFGVGLPGELSFWLPFPLLLDSRDDRSGVCSPRLGVVSCAPLTAPRVSRFLPWGRSSNGRVLIRPDLRRPFSVKEVGPSASIRFQGGETALGFRALGGGVVSRVRRFLNGGSSSSVPLTWPLTPLSPLESEGFKVSF